MLNERTQSWSRNRVIDYGATLQAKSPGPGTRQPSIAESAASPQSKDVGSMPGGQSTKVMRFSFRSLMKPVAIEFLINTRSGSKNPSTLTRTTAGRGTEKRSEKIRRDYQSNDGCLKSYAKKSLRFLWIPSCVQVVTSMICTIWLRNDGLRVGPIAPFAHLFERAKSTRKADEPTGSPRHLHFALVHRVHDDLCQQTNQKKKTSVESEYAKRGRADSTDSTLIDKIVPVREEAPEHVIRTLIDRRERPYLFTALFVELYWAHSTACALALTSRTEHRCGNDGSDITTVFQDRARNDAHHASRSTAIHERARTIGEGAT